MSILRYGFPASNGRQTPDVVSTGRLTPDVNTLNSSMYEGTGVRSGAATPSSEEAIIALVQLIISNAFGAPYSNILIIAESWDPLVQGKPL